MYLIGFVAGWLLARYRARRPGSTWTALDIDDLIFYCAVGVILGGRIGWCIFYGHDVIAESWLNVFRIWDGGMSFHGGMLGVIVATPGLRAREAQEFRGRAGFRGAASGHRADGGPDRQFHQRRAVGQAHACALGLRRRRIRTAP